MEYSDIVAGLAEMRLVPRGGFAIEDADGVPGGGATLLLAGFAGPEMWRAFTAGRASADEPLDDWTRRGLSPIAEKLGAKPLFPFGGPPHLPFQRWAMKAGGVHVSPVCTLIDADFGLWHAYRGALVFAKAVSLPAADARSHPCEDCADRPCLSACPVDAWTESKLDLGACVTHLGQTPGGDCMTRGCRARRTCPVGHVYEPAQAGFHMAAFFARLRDRAA